MAFEININFMTDKMAEKSFVKISETINGRKVVSENFTERQNGFYGF